MPLQYIVQRLLAIIAVDLLSAALVGKTGPPVAQSLLYLPTIGHQIGGRVNMRRDRWTQHLIIAAQHDTNDVGGTGY